MISLDSGEEREGSCETSLIRIRGNKAIDDEGPWDEGHGR